MAHAKSRSPMAEASIPPEQTTYEDPSPPADPRRDLVGMLRDEYEAIHGPLPRDWLKRYLDAAGLSVPEERASTDQQLAALYACVHGLGEEVGRSALCLSGGGIRSAAFSFGALRAMARAGVLQRFHYLSTVSGGGYIGSWLTAWIHRHFTDQRSDAPRTERLAQVSALLAAGAGHDALGGARPPEVGPVSHVRRFTNYLSPRTGALALDTWTLAAVYLRNLLLNWLVVLPLLAAALLVPWLLVDGLGAVGLAGGADADHRLAVILVPAAAALAVWLLLIVGAAVDSRSDDVGGGEERSRLEAWFLRLAASWALFSALVLYGPTWVAEAPSLLAAAGGASGLATMVLKKVDDRSSRPGAEVKRSARLVRVATTAAAVLTVALVLVGLAAAARAAALGLRGLAPWPWVATPAGAPAVVAAFMVAAVALSAVAALVIDINEFSLHALYRNRLVRGFLRASRGHQAPDSDTEFDPEDDLSLAALWPAGAASSDPAEAPHLFHVINATLNDLGGTRPEWSERKGVSFTFSPLHLGAHIAGRYGDVRLSRSGYRRLDRNDRSPYAIRLGTAMSISGAAASPNMGYHSSAAVTFLLALFNVRLGWWLPAPWGDVKPGRLRRTPRSVWRAWWEEAFGATRFTSPVLNVSDGGHFDNLGLYEMVRRRCRSVVVLDGGQDGGRTFASLGEALRKIRVDFGVPITFTGLDLAGAGGKAQEPAPGHVYHGTIHYSRVDRVPGPEGAGTVPARDGTILYVRPAVTGDEPADVQAYQRMNPAFPHESTTDQWFSESQFESYRALGEHTIQHLVDYYHASKGQLRHRGADRAAAHPGLSPDRFCHQLMEAMALMRRHRELSSHAGGVVYRVAAGRLEFLLVRSTDGLNRILPKGYIEPWEDPVAAAIREVREETGYTLEPIRNLGVASFDKPTGRVTTTYFLMEEPEEETGPPAYEDYRNPEWLTIEDTGSANPPVPPDVIPILRQAESVIRTHAGGVARRRQNGQPEFLLVRVRGADHYVLPTGPIERGEEAVEAAERELAEESGHRFVAERSLGVFELPSGADRVVVEYFLMSEPDPASVRGPGTLDRDPRWFTLEEARADRSVPPDVLAVLERAEADGVRS